jgi:hypothetical protein
LGWGGAACWGGALGAGWAGCFGQGCCGSWPHLGGGFWATMMIPGAGAAGALSEARNHCAMASADIAATVSKALFRDVSVCKIFGKLLGKLIPLRALRRHSTGCTR